MKGLQLFNNVRRVAFNEPSHVGETGRISILRPSVFGNPYPVGKYSKREAIARYEAEFDRMLQDNPNLYKAFLKLKQRADNGEVLELLCVCRTGTPCHGDTIVKRLIR